MGRAGESANNIGTNRALIQLKISCAETVRKGGTEKGGGKTAQSGGKISSACDDWEKPVGEGGLNWRLVPQQGSGKTASCAGRGFAPETRLGTRKERRLISPTAEGKTELRGC